MKTRKVTIPFQPYQLPSEPITGFFIDPSIARAIATEHAVEGTIEFRLNFSQGRDAGGVRPSAIDWMKMLLEGEIVFAGATPHRIESVTATNRFATARDTVPFQTDVIVVMKKVKPDGKKNTARTPNCKTNATMTVKPTNSRNPKKRK